VLNRAFLLINIGPACSSMCLYQDEETREGRS